MILGLSSSTLLAQNADDVKIVQFYGIVFEQDSSAKAIGAHVYNPVSKRGTSTDYLGYFSLPVKTGDSLVVSYVGYQTHPIVVPNTPNHEYAEFIYLKIDTTQLEALRVQPYMTERQFKEAILAANTLSFASGLPVSSFSLYRNTVSNYFYTLQQARLQQERLYGGGGYLSISDLIVKPVLRALRKKQKNK